MRVLPVCFGLMVDCASATCMSWTHGGLVAALSTTVNNCSLNISDERKELNGK